MIQCKPKNLLKLSKSHLEKEYRALTVSLTVSPPDSEFTCSSGDCVSMTARCDGRAHCRDRSDEANCRLVVPPVGYNKFLVPTSADNHQRLRVNISLDFQRILYIDEEEHFIRATFTIRKFWYNEHLSYQNLKKGGVNQVFQDDKDSIWIPNIESRTMEEINKCARTEKREILKIIPNTDFRHEQNALTERENAFLFSGLENKMFQEREITCEFICEFDYRWYPFDTQVGTDNNTINFYPSCRLSTSDLSPSLQHV